MKKQIAMRPDFFANFPTLQKETEAKKRGATDKEQAYYSMSLSAGWKYFDKEIDELLEEMDQLIDNSVANGMTREQIGENTIVVSLARGVIKRLRNKVQDSKEACDPTGETGGREDSGE